MVLAYFTANPKNSVSDAETPLRFSSVNIIRIVVKHMWSPIKYDHVQKLKAQDLPARLKFYERYSKSVIWTN